MPTLENQKLIQTSQMVSTKATIGTNYIKANSSASFPIPPTTSYKSTSLTMSVNQIPIIQNSCNKQKYKKEEERLKGEWKDMY